ncbi:MAG: phosphoribosylformylglycinamidine synthase I [Candidatus Baltobacteraceae bacterium]
MQRGTSASMRVGVLVFPGTNSEEETARACEAVGLDTDIVHWKTPPERVREYAALVLPGGFAYEDRVRAGAIAAHDRLVDVVREAAAEGKPVLGICNGAQILLETGLVPGFAAAPGERDGRRPQAGFTRNAPHGKYVSRHAYVKLNVAPDRCTFTARLPAGAVLPAWASHGEGRLAATQSVLERIVADDHVAFVYCDREGNVTPESTPNGSALGAAALTNVAGNVLAIMPHPERAGWVFMQRDGLERERARGDRDAFLAPAGGIALFAGLAAAL